VAPQTPSGRIVTFGDHQIIVSKTDLKGRITYANDVFEQVSEYTHDELMGQFYNLVRHPDTPRGIFKLLWDTIGSGRELLAYLPNLTKSRDTYWVLAHVTPTYKHEANGSRSIVGFHSNRRTPAPVAVQEAEKLYRVLLAEERRHTHAPQAAEASLALLSRVLRDRNQTYEEFVWSLIDSSKKAA
jgi:PAS domain S-box-containing protein